MTGVVIVARSSQSKTVVYLENRLRITKFYTDLHTDLPYICTGYGVINYFQSEVIAKKNVENAASDGFRWNFLRKD